LVITLFCNPAIVVLILALAILFVHACHCGSCLAAYGLLSQDLVLIYVTIHLKGQRKGGDLLCSVPLWGMRALLCYDSNWRIMFGNILYIDHYIFRRVSCSRMMEDTIPGCLSCSTA